MANLTIRNLEEELKQRLRVRAARNGRSMEEEARVILRDAVGGPTGPELWNLSRRLFGDADGVELDLPTRAEDRPAPDFDPE